MAETGLSVHVYNAGSVKQLGF